MIVCLASAPAGALTTPEGPLEPRAAIVDDLAETVTATAGGVVDGAGGAVGGVVDEVDGAVGSTTGDTLDRSTDLDRDEPERAEPPEGEPRDTADEPDPSPAPSATEAAPSPSEDQGVPAAPAEAEGDERSTGQARSAGRSAERHLSPVEAVGERAAVPLALVAALAGFLGLQAWVDRRDPKLVSAPVEAEPDLTFDGT